MAGPSSNIQARNTKTMAKVLGISMLETEDEGVFQEEIISPRSSLRALHLQSDLGDNFSNWLKTMKKLGQRIA